MKRKNKKGISELLSYVLLITIAIAMAGGVYAYLRFYAEEPLPEPECQGVSVALIDYSCEDNWMSLTLENTGLHSVSVKVRLYDGQGKIIGEALYKTSRGAIGVLGVEEHDKQADMDVKYNATVKKIGVLPFQIVGGTGQKFCPGAEVALQVENCLYSTTTAID